MHPTIAPSPHKVVVIGGGFAGYNLVKTLARDTRFAITLVDQNNFNYFVPLLYQVATGFLETSSISYPFRKLIRTHKNVRFRLGTFLRVDPDLNTCYLDNGALHYDTLVFAMGAVTNFFGNANIARHAIPMKTVADALNMRNRLLQTLEEACRSEDPLLRKKLSTVVVAGGGPTGVEVSGVIAELRKHIIHKDYPELNGSLGDVYLVEGSACLLPLMRVDSQRHSQEALTALGVKVILGKFITDFQHQMITLSDGSVIESGNLIWAAGVIVQKTHGLPEASFGKSNRLLVDACQRVYGTKNMFALGDACLQNTDPNFPKGHPQLAQVAIQQALNLAHNMSATEDNSELRPFRYHDKGTLAIVGRNKAVADLTVPHVHVSGRAGLLIWLFVHLHSLISCQNKARTLINWIIGYITRDQSLRMIVRPQQQTSKDEAVVQPIPAIFD